MPGVSDISRWVSILKAIWAVVVILVGIIMLIMLYQSSQQPAQLHIEY